MAEKRGLGERRRGRMEFGKRHAAHRAFLRQAEALSRHEAKIAAHTEIQSWTNIIAVATSILMTLALAWIAYQQWHISALGFRLESARSNNLYKVELSGLRAPGTGSNGIVPASGGTQGLTPTRLSLELLRGEASIVSTRAIQHFQISPEHGKARCKFISRSWWIAESMLNFSSPFGHSLQSLNLSEGELAASVVPTKTQIEILYYNVFGDLLYDTIEVDAHGRQKLIRNSKMRNGDKEYILSRVPGGVSLSTNRGVIDEPCRPYVRTVLPPSARRPARSARTIEREPAEDLSGLY